MNAQWSGPRNIKKKYEKKIDVISTIESIGTLLADALFTSEIKKHFDKIQLEATNEKKGVRILLGIEWPKASNYPWEALYKDNKFIATFKGTSLARFIPNIPTPKRNFDKPLKILIISSSPSDKLTPYVQAEQEIEIIEKSLKKEIDSGAIILDTERIGEVNRIMEDLNIKPYNIVHFIGHGVFENGVGKLALQDKDGRLDLADHEIIGRMFLNQTSLCLVVLNACEGAATSSSKVFTGLAPELMRTSGIPSVIAMRYSITIDTAKRFSEVFYKNLPDKGIEEAMQLTRSTISVQLDPTIRKDFIIPILFMNAVVSAPQVASESDENVWFSKGKDLYELEKYDEAIPYFNKVLEINPKHADAWNNKGNALMLSVEWDEKAIQCFDEAIKINPKHADAWNNKGNALNKSDKHIEAITCFDKVLEINPIHADAWYGKGEALLNLRKYDEAIQHFDKAIRINSKHANACYGKGEALLNLRKYDEAIQHFDKVLEINPIHEDAWRGKVSALNNLNRYDEAISFLDTIIKNSSKNADAWNSKGNALLNLRKYDEAIPCFDEAIKINPKHDDAWNSKGNALNGKGKALNEDHKFDEATQMYNEALQCFEKAIKINKKNVDAWEGKASALAFLGRSGDVWKDKEYVHLRANSIKAYLELYSCALDVSATADDFTKSLPILKARESSKSIAALASYVNLLQKFIQVDPFLPRYGEYIDKEDVDTIKTNTDELKKLISQGQELLIANKYEDLDKKLTELTTIANKLRDLSKNNLLRLLEELQRGGRA